MDCEYRHQSFDKFPRRSQSLCNDRCQNILYKAVFEHIKEIKTIAALLLASKSFLNSSFGPNFVVNFIINDNSIELFNCVLRPSLCLPLQFVPSLHIDNSVACNVRYWLEVTRKSAKIIAAVVGFADELMKSKYFRSSLRSLSMDYAHCRLIRRFFVNNSVAWPNLRSLNLFRGGAEDNDLASICGAAPNMSSLSLMRCHCITDGALSFVSKLSDTLRTLTIDGCRQITDAGIKHVAQLFRVTSLNLPFCREITDDSLKFVSKLSGITFLDLYSSYSITDAGLAHLSNLSRITSLDLSECDNLTDAGLKHVSKLACITVLNLARCNAITDAGLEHISNLSGITALDLSFCVKITDAGLECISTKLSGIVTLALQNCRNVTDRGLEHVSRLSNISSLNLYNCIVGDVGLEHVSKLTGITSLDLSGIPITDRGLECVATLPAVRKITVYHCQKVTERCPRHVAKLSSVIKAQCCEQSPNRCKPCARFDFQGWDHSHEPISPREGF